MLWPSKFIRWKKLKLHFRWTSPGQMLSRSRDHDCSHPLHGSGQAGFPHPALASGDNAHAAQGIGMTDGRQRQPASDEAPHTLPEDASVLATPRQRTMPEPSHLESKKSQRRVVQGHSVIPEVSTHHRL